MRKRGETHLRNRTGVNVPTMTTDETRFSALRSNRNALGGLLLIAAILLVVALLAALNWGAILLVPVMVLVGVALVASLWVMGMKGRRR